MMDTLSGLGPSAAILCQMGTGETFAQTPPRPIDLDAVVAAAADGETSVAGVAAVAEAMGLPMTPPQH